MSDNIVQDSFQDDDIIGLQNIKSQLEMEIHALTTRKEELSKEKVAKGNLKDEIKKLEEKKSDIEKSLKDEEQKREKAKSEKEQAESQYKIKQDQLVTLDFDIKEQESELASLGEVKAILEDSVQSLEARKDSLATQVSEEEKKALKMKENALKIDQGLQKKLEEKEEELALLNNKIESGMEERVKLEGIIDELGKQGENLERRNNDLLTKVTRQEQEATEKKEKWESEFTKKKEKQEEELKKEKEEIEQLRGDLAIREGFLEEKRKKLVKVKSDLEHFHGKQLKHIIIPNE